eukprot:jgi/Galph1/2876/GphlegSOOS_G1499.1
MHIFLEPIVEIQPSCRISVVVDADDTVSKLRETVKVAWHTVETEDVCSVSRTPRENEDQNFWLVFRGKCLEDTDATLSAIGLREGDVVRVVKRKEQNGAISVPNTNHSGKDTNESVRDETEDISEVLQAENGRLSSCDEGRPTICEIQPNTGLSCGGSKVQVIGKNFHHGLFIRFGRVVVPCQTYSSTILTCVTPPHAPGVVSVELDISGHGQFVDDNCLYTYVDFSVFHNIFAIAAKNSNPVRVPAESCKEMNEETMMNRRK